MSAAFSFVLCFFPAVACDVEYSSSSSASLLATSAFVALFHRVWAWLVQKNRWKDCFRGHFRTPIFTNSVSFSVVEIDRLSMRSLSWLLDVNGPFSPLLLWKWTSVVREGNDFKYFIKAVNYLMSIFLWFRKVSGRNNKALRTGFNC